MSTAKLEGPLLARYSEDTPPGSRTGGRVIDELAPLLQSTGKAFTYDSHSPLVDLAQITSFAEIDGTGKKASSMLVMKLSRIGGDGSDTYTGDALMVEFDVHYESDGHGTQSEFIKRD